MDSDATEVDDAQAESDDDSAAIANDFGDALVYDTN